MVSAWPTLAPPRQLGALLFNTVDDAGTVWLCSALDGWSGADTVGSLTQRVADHGAYDSPQWYGPRTLTFSGIVQAPDAATRDAARDKLAANVPLTLGVDLVVGETVPKTMRVKRSGQLLWQNRPGNVFTFAAGLVAPDPRKYALTTSTLSTTLPSAMSGLAPPWVPPLVLPANPIAGTISAVNAGDIPAPWVIRLDGPMVNPVITHAQSGRRLAYTLTLGVGDFVLLNSLDSTVLLGGTGDTSGAVQFGSAWFRLSPGGNDVSLTADSGTGSLTLTYASTWS
jgi:Phage tail protein